MDNPIIREWLLKKEFRVYSVIVNTYADKINELKPSLFRKWLANELNITTDAINLSSLNSALNRQRKKGKGNINAKAATSSAISGNTSSVENFVFSTPDSNTPPKSRIEEL